MTAMPEIKKSDSEAEECVRRMLREYNSAFMNASRDYSFHIEEDGQISAGIVAESVADTVEVSFLCVRKDLRGSGHGKALLTHLEEAAKGDGMKRILLNTYSFQAPDFYRRMGYRQLFVVDPCFENYSQHYFVKEL